MELVNLKTGTDSYQDESGETRTRDEYPWGLCITLNNDTLNKLKAQPQGVGTEVMITAKAVIRGLSARETDDGVNRSADLQITDMAIHLKRLEIIKKRMNKILSENTGKSVETVTADCERDNFMTADEAVAYGLIDKVFDKH